MTWFSYIYPQTIARFSSSYNRDIRVVEEFGRYKLLVSGSPQSGPYIEKLWKAAFKSFKIHTQPIQSILVFGIAGATVIHLIRDQFARARIVAVDIDSQMIAIGRKFFGINRIPKLTIVCKDAKTFVPQELRKKRHYDLIIVDLSFGRHIPSFVSTEAFLRELKKLMSHNGTIVINFLREREYKDVSSRLKERLLRIFSGVSEKPIFLNRFFCVR